ncbi:MAG TPA: DUF488 family protein [Pseudonocardiaceae bacterium]|jgi:uncharacterized protein YeaO (DUF488 family)|nr:DUF488 family protein [Pseudonocardiaceae bacterium]
MSGRTIRVVRVYDAVSEADGDRVLVDRIWPRGVGKDQLEAATWLKDVAPSTELRTWYGHDPAKFTEFEQRYRDELAGAAGLAALDRLRAHGSRPTLTLLTATKDVEHSHAVILAGLLRDGDR